MHDDDIDVLIPTAGRRDALAATLTALLFQTHPRLRVVLSDQDPRGDLAQGTAAAAVIRLLRHRGTPVELHEHLPRRGMAEQRDFLLSRAQAPYALFLDDDVILEADVIARLASALKEQQCGFVGAFPNSPSGVSSDKPIDEPPPDLGFPWWSGPVQAEDVRPGGPGWERRLLHFAAYPVRVAARHAPRTGLYKCAWVGGCWMVDVAKLRALGGFGFWTQLPPEHCGEDVLAQLRLMRAHGGAALWPSGAWHQEVPTTIAERRYDAPLLLDV